MLTQYQISLHCLKCGCTKMYPVYIDSILIGFDIQNIKKNSFPSIEGFCFYCQNTDLLSEMKQTLPLNYSILSKYIIDDTNNFTITLMFFALPTSNKKLFPSNDNLCLSTLLQLKKNIAILVFDVQNKIWMK